MPEPMAAESSDAELAHLIRQGNRSAASEVLLRHEDAVLVHARLYCPHERDAQQVTNEAFAQTLQAVRDGSGPTAAWRPYLVTAVRRAAARWADEGHGPRLSDGFAQWIASLPGHEGRASAAEAAEENSILLRSFRTLPDTWQATLWENLTTATAAAETGADAEAARKGLWEAYLQACAHTSDRSCRHLTAILGDTVRHRAAHTELDTHTAWCERCRTARIELTAIHIWNRDVLYRALMLWPAGLPLRPAPATAQDGVTALRPAAASAFRRASRWPAAAWTGHHSRSLVLCIGLAAAIAAAITTMVSLAEEGTPRSSPEPLPVTTPPGTQADAGATARPAASPPAVTPTATTDSSSAPSPDPDSPSPSSRPAGFRLLNTRTGLCVGPDAPGATYIQLQVCTEDPSQRWERIAAGDKAYQLRNTGTGKCLDGTSGGGNAVEVVQADCIRGANRTRQLWTFAAEPDGKSFRLRFVPPVPASDYPAHLLGPQTWTDTHPPRRGTHLVQLPDYYHAASFAFAADDDSGEGDGDTP
ncbi:RICIN domain-containing protein [Streptomyces sp. NPDC097981]|uniref:RICIN domain-containing protein n=1 Tax=Streptomyces sp. NPDC097981 TaxID=3155428 RepID=UPI003316A2AD